MFPYVPGQEVYSVAYEEFTPIALLAKGEETTLSMNLNFSAGEIGESYFAMPYINDKMLDDYTLFFTLADKTGAVEDIASDEIAISYEKNTSMLTVKGEVSSLILSSMDGIIYDKTAEAASGSADLSNLPSGIFIVRATTPDGTVKTLKIMK
ncbi:MAG: T9SS type A sorting domain-containing protein [Muribaculaceae bacterium]|nr:T9SS type A sorting domain-containing protein [Muribaculaceae bacterium]